MERHLTSRRRPESRKNAAMRRCRPVGRPGFQLIDRRPPWDGLRCISCPDGTPRKPEESGFIKSSKVKAWQVYRLT